MADNGLEGRVALITGSTGGIGSAISKELYNSGAKLVITGRSQSKLDNLKSNLLSGIKDEPYNIHCVPLDLEMPDAEKILVAQAIEKFGRIDILVNNAAMMDAKLFIKITPEFMNKMLLINFLVPMRIMQQTLPYMSKKKYGRIINITSLASAMGDTGMSPYAATKGALTSLSKAVASEYACRGITINCVAPGLIATEALKNVSDSHRDFLKRQIPAGRYGTPTEVASIVSHLATEKAAYINGQVIHVNGGIYR